MRAYNMEPDGRDVPVSLGEDVAFQWVHEGNRMIVTRCVRLQYADLPRAWAKEEWPPAAGVWAPVQLIGQGGNGEVWRAKDHAGHEAAIKYLRRTTREGYLRFRAEVEVMRTLAGVKGVLPLLGCSLPSAPSLTEPAWLAMPLMQPLEGSQATDTLEGLVAAFAEIATTLAEIHRRGISHRDVKPSNLFWTDGGAVIGDFGLAELPDKEPVTLPGRKLGPMFYLAPEMLNEPHAADGQAADVYSLAKSLWVLATGQNYPIPGEHRDSVWQTRITSYVSHPQGRHLDGLVARCTRHGPDERPPMAEVASDLAAWLGGRCSTKRSTPRSCTERELAKVAVQLTDPQRIILHCRQCGQGWSPNILPGGRLPRGYWRCPHGCNWGP